jgi:hypothetical protein
VRETRGRATVRVEVEEAMMHRTRRWCVLFSVAGASLGAMACNAGNGSSGAAPNFSITVDGTIDGGVLEFLDVGSLSGQGGVGGGGLSYAEVYATNKAPACGWLDGTNNNRGDLTTLALLVSNSGGAMAPAAIAPGTYMLGYMYNQDAGVNQQATANFLTSNATCQNDQTLTAQMGSITFTSITADAIVGSYDVTFSSGDHLTGTFNAPTCTSALPPPLPDAGDAGLDAGFDATADANNCHP